MATSLPRVLTALVVSLVAAAGAACAPGTSSGARTPSTGQSSSGQASSGQASSGSAAAPGQATQLLNELTVRPEGSMSGYSRERFPHWKTVEGKCDTREAVLKRDGRNVRTDDNCKATAGEWTSPYDGETWTNAADVDIDHMVPLANAWRSGAADWTDEQRQKFANDLDHHQLFAVTDNVNQAKGDQGPESWKPPLTTYWCTYAGYWIEVKHAYRLSVNDKEKAALLEMLGHC
ncbi:HNH endonuclease family protein [Goodfellowiella coeruleoviolacea]|uniref:GmrSD restriction endonucleases C-terminal domain-containing protein n=1 Tax=Goodfellowiella coeruleoviolacea TaxID=334858 RepID=A0AAE3GI92_9PSEU|nr:HNH endonuclease family protein [Goodfellowiella coeruleoviolacea]MCP2168655.1 Protein of unknown function (DUF1524) [Goodfellowiella coeruleoviolacea]